MLTESEFDRVLKWQPYREDWPVDRNKSDDNIESYYGELIRAFLRNDLFDCYFSQNGEMGNYLEFYCYPKGSKTYEGPAIIVCVSLCCPIACYGPSKLWLKEKSTGLGGLFDVEDMYKITDIRLVPIEKEILSILNKNNLMLLEKEFAARKLPPAFLLNNHYENLNEGILNLQGMFQLID
jgi:hypothetical protein